MVAASLTYARHPTVAKVVKRMEQTLRAPLSVEELAASVGLSERSLLRRFRATLNVSPHEYYRVLRLDVGRRLLDNSDLSVTEIAIACGFESRGSFTRAFKTTFGAPPSRHRAATRS
jgi:transcriptional regulator GlxA family with amidase domain